MSNAGLLPISYIPSKTIWTWQMFHPPNWLFMTYDWLMKGIQIFLKLYSLSKNYGQLVKINKKMYLLTMLDNDVAISLLNKYHTLFLLGYWKITSSSAAEISTGHPAGIRHRGISVCVYVTSSKWKHARCAPASIPVEGPDTVLFWTF